MSALPHKPVKAFGLGIVLWLTGFVWGSIVFMNPALHLAPIPYVSSNPAISLPILVMWFFLCIVMTRYYLGDAIDKRAEGLKLGVTLAAVNVMLDLIVLVFLLKTGFRFFVSLSVWIAYTMLLLVPWYVGKKMSASRM